MAHGEERQRALIITVGTGAANRRRDLFATAGSPSPKRTRSRYTVARYLLAGRPQPRIEDAVRIGELMRLTALSLEAAAVAQSLPTHRR